MIYSERFDKWFIMELKFEGGYANDPDDKGGLTYMGITKKYYPNLKIWKNLLALKTVKEKKAYKPTNEELEEIKNIYYKNYFAKVKGDYYHNEDLAFQVADFAVNAGVITSVKKLQQIMHITVDGIVGVQTITTANNFKNILPAFIQARINYYETIARKGNNKKFLKGWLNRVNQCKA